MIEKIQIILIRSILTAVLVIGFVFWFILKGWGILGVGWGWLIGQALMSFTYLLIWNLHKKEVRDKKDN